MSAVCRGDLLRGGAAIAATLATTPWTAVCVAWLCFVGAKTLRMDALTSVSAIELAGGVVIAGLTMGAWPRAFGSARFERWGCFTFIALFAALLPVAASGFYSLFLDARQTVLDTAGAGASMGCYLLWIGWQGVPVNALNRKIEP
ncbi:hypothetical protein [Dolichospermum phage Dfl-JY45]